MTPEIASVLVKSRGKISLNSLTKLSVEVAEIFANFTGELYLGGHRLTTSVEAIEKISRHRGPILSLQRITEMNPEIAKILSSHVGQLRISSFHDVGFTEDELITLASHQGDLWIQSKITLTDRSIDALVKHRGHLMLPWVLNFSPAIAKKFKKHEGPVDIA